MAERWPRVALGQMTTQVRHSVPVAAGAEYPLLGVRWYAQGAFHRETVTSATSKAKRLNRVRPGLFIYNRLFAGKGSFGLVTENLAGSYVSNEFPLFECDPSRLLPEYLAVFFGQPGVWDEIERVSTGTTASRNRWKEQAFASYAIPLPPIADQARIVDLIAAFDDAARSAHRALDSAVAAHRAVVTGALSANPGTAPVADLAEHIIGGAWGSAPGVEQVPVTALGPSVFAGHAVDLDPSTGTPRSLSASRHETRSIRRGDILLERSGGTDEQPVGRVVRSANDQPSVVPSDFMRLIRIDPSKADPAYVFWAMWARYHRGDTKAFQSKTTNIRNLRVPDYLGSPIPLPDAHEQKQIVGLAEEFLVHRNRAVQHSECLDQARSAVATSLLSGTHEIPSSYDELLSEAT